MYSIFCQDDPCSQLPILTPQLGVEKLMFWILPLCKFTACESLEYIRKSRLALRFE